MINGLYIILTAALGVVAYIVNRYFDYKNKKAELNYSFFQEHKMKAIVKFFDCYAKAEKMWFHFPIYGVLNKQLKASDLDNIISPEMDNLTLCICELTLYLEPTEMIPFKEINERLMDLNIVVHEAFTYDNKQTNPISIGNKYGLEKRKVIADCKKLLTEIGVISREQFIKK